MSAESPLPPVPPARPQMPPVPQMSNALGIWAVILTFTGCCTLLGLILGIIGIVLGALGRKKHAKCATGGLVLSILGLIFGLLLFLACAACVGAAASL